MSDPFVSRGRLAAAGRRVDGLGGGTGDQDDEEERGAECLAGGGGEWLRVHVLNIVHGRPLVKSFLEISQSLFFEVPDALLCCRASVEGQGAVAGPVSDEAAV